MSGIVLSSAVRQNLLALQDTAASLATTQNDLSTGKKVNSALDNPTNFFTAAGLDNRASDISNLLDGISNGVQVLQAANTGITSVESLVSQAKSIANQALQTSIGYSTKSNVVSAAITDSNGNAVTASNLLGTGTVTAGATTGSAVTATAAAPLTASTTLASLGFTNVYAIGIGGYGIGFDGSSGQTTGQHLDLAVATVGDLLNDAQTNSLESITYSISGGQITLNGTNFDITDGSGTPAEKLGLTTGSSLSTQTGSVVTVGSGTSAITGSSLLTGLTSAFTTSDTLTVNGKTISFNSGSGTSTSSSGTSIDLTSATVSQLLTTINGYSGGSSSINSTTGAITLNSSISANLVISGTGTLAKLGLTGGTFPPTGNTLAFGAVGNGTATSITFGTGTGQVSTLDQLNSALATDNLSATLDTSGKLTISTTNDAASSSIPTPTGTAVSGSTGAFHSASVTAPVADATSQTARATLVSQYNAILTQIDNTAADSSYNGVNLLNGDQLQLTFNETGKSKLNITGVNFGSAGLGLSALTSGTDFIDNNATNKVLTTLNGVSSNLRSEASALGSNLSVVQTRQDFNTNLINVLQTGSANLTQADINLEAANSQALSTRQSLSVSALSLANQSQQSVLQLLR